MTVTVTVFRMSDSAGVPEKAGVQETVMVTVVRMSDSAGLPEKASVSHKR